MHERWSSAPREDIRYHTRRIGEILVRCRYGGNIGGIRYNLCFDEAF